MGLGLVLWSLLALGCTQEADLKPRLDAVLPSSLTAGRDGYVILEGRFGVGLAWEEDGPSTDESHRVLFGGKLSPEVHLLSPAHLSARLPEGGLAAGSMDVEVMGPNGQAAVLAGALCVAEQSEIKLLAGCVVDGRSNVCAADLDGESLALDVLLPGAVASILVTPPLYQAVGMAPGYDLSRDGLRAVYLSLENIGVNESRLELKFGAVDDPESHEVVLSRDIDAMESLFVSFPKISPDGKRLAYVQDEHQIILHDIDSLSGELGPPRQIFDSLDDEPESTLMWMEMDPTSRRVVMTRILPIEEACIAVTYGFQRSELLVLDLDDGRILFRTQPEDRCRSDGPGIFHPAGDRLLFVSNREGRLVASPFGDLLPSNSVYSRGLHAEDPAVDLLRYQTAMFLGPPSISPDAKKLAIAGMFSDLSGFGWDALILDLEVGVLNRVYNEYVANCAPPLSETCTPGDVFGEECCTSDGHCCDPATGAYCPTWDFTPVFGPSGQAIVYNGMPYIWRCRDTGRWGSESTPGMKLFWGEWVTEYQVFFGFDLTPQLFQMQLVLSSPRFIELPICSQ